MEKFELISDMETHVLCCQTVVKAEALDIYPQEEMLNIEYIPLVPNFTQGQYFCEMCPNHVFDKKKNLTQHINRHAKNENLNKKCEICQKKTRNMKKHITMNHSNEKPHRCNVCKANFTTKCKLKV